MKNSRSKLNTDISLGYKIINNESKRSLTIQIKIALLNVNVL